MLLSNKNAIIYGGGPISGTVAAFVASDQARTMTAAMVNISAGVLLD
jgi:hypothetical protein